MLVKQVVLELLQTPLTCMLFFQMASLIPVGRKSFFLIRRGTINLLPGSTIVIPRDPRPFDWLVMTRTIAPIFSNLATSAAAIAAISND